MSIKKFCSDNGISTEQFYGEQEINGNLNWSHLKSIPKGANLKVSEDIDLRNLKSISEGVTLTAGGSILLNNLTSLPEEVTLTAGRYIYLIRLESIPEGFKPPFGRTLYLPKGVSCEVTHIEDSYETPCGKYILSDGILTEIIQKKGNVYKVRRIGKSEVTYLVTDGNGKWSHGDTLKEAKGDLIYKISSRDTSKFKGLSLKSTLKFEQCIEAYRVITGACSGGVRNFVEGQVGKPKKEYTVGEVIEITKGQYGWETFKGFFG